MFLCGGTERQAGATLGRLFVFILDDFHYLPFLVPFIIRCRSKCLQFVRNTCKKTTNPIGDGDDFCRHAPALREESTLEEDSVHSPN